jgi:hypothetical protein
MQETNVRNTVCCATIEHGCRHLASIHGEKSKLLNVEGLKLEQLKGNHFNCVTVQHAIAGVV